MKMPMSIWLRLVRGSGTNKKFREKTTVLGIFISVILFYGNTFAFSGIMSETGAEVRIVREWKGFHCGYTEPSRLVIKTEDQWKEVWEKLHVLRLPKPELPKIAFEKEMAVAVFMGKRSSGGYEVEITKITKTEEEIIVEVVEKEPPPESLQTMVLTQPYHIAVVKNYPLPVRFQSP